MPITAESFWRMAEAYGADRNCPDCKVVASGDYSRPCGTHGRTFDLSWGSRPIRVRIDGEQFVIRRHSTEPGLYVTANGPDSRLAVLCDEKRSAILLTLP